MGTDRAAPSGTEFRMTITAAPQSPACPANNSKVRFITKRIPKRQGQVKIAGWSGKNLVELEQNGKELNQWQQSGEILRESKPVSQ